MGKERTKVFTMYVKNRNGTHDGGVQSARERRVTGKKGKT
jgi:hypothetical protein